MVKHRHSRYCVENGNPAWIKIKNRKYSQIVGRDELLCSSADTRLVVRLKSAGTSATAPVLPNWEL